MKVFEFTGQAKEKIFDFHAAPGNINDGMAILNSKFGMAKSVQEYKENLEKNVDEFKNRIKKSGQK